jgi:hypothetical protein
MKKFKVIMFLMIPHQSSVENPKTKKVVFEVNADNPLEAYKKAEKMNDSLWSVWDYKVLFCLA